MIQEVTAEGKLVGHFDADGVYRKWVNGTQFMHIAGDAIGIMEDTIQKLAREPSWVRIEVDVIDGEFKGLYTASKDVWMAPNIRTHEYAGWGLQRFLPLKRMKKLS